MIFTTIKQNLRSLKRNRLFTALNLCGFVLGLTASMILALYIYREYNVDKCFPNYQNIYLLVNTENNNVNIDFDLAAMLKDRFPEVEEAATFYYSAAGQGAFLRGESNNEFITDFSICSVTNNFFRMFSVKTALGDPQSPFTDDNSVALTVSMAQKLFGRLDVVGETVYYSRTREHVVSAVIEDMPVNSAFAKAGFFVNSNKPENRFSTTNMNDKRWNPHMIYVQLAGTANSDSFAESVNRSFPPVNGIDHIRLVPLADTYMATDLVGKRTEQGNPALITIFIAITLAILLLSIFNYINFSLSKQLATLKTVGIRIAVGANLARLRTMFVSEAALLILISYLLALLFTYMVFPFVQTELLNVPMHFNDLFSPTLLGLSLVVLGTIVVITSLAPMYIISRFDIQSLFGKGKMRLGKQRVKQIFTSLQLAATVVLLVSLFTIYKQLDYARNYHLGFDKEHLIRIDLGFSENRQAFKQAVNQFAFVERSALSSGAPGRVNTTADFNVIDDSGEELKLISQVIGIDENFMETMGIRLVEGREFLTSDMGVSCYINEEALKQAGWQSYEGKRYHNLGGYDIIGIANDFSMLSVHKKQEPIVLLTVKEGNMFLNHNTLSVRLRPGNLPEQLAELERVWRRDYPNAPFSYTFYDDVFDAFYRKEAQQAKGIASFSVIALLITCRGLIGQVFQACLIRRKEIGIRKIFGAGIMDILALFNMTFVKLFIVAFIIAAPVAYYFMNQWLQTFAYQTPLNWWIFAMAGAATLSITLIVVSLQCWSVARANPAEAIKAE
jgi:putative ABC transport system permease protein